MKNVTLLIAFLLCLWCNANAATYYVRADGGTSTQCTGTTNAAYPGSGTGQACALIHPAWALGGAGDNTASGIMDAGDTLQFADDAEYMIGYGMPNTSGCSAAASRNCQLGTPPAGADVDHKTKIYGYNYDSCPTTPSAKTQLWGTEKVNHVIGIDSNTDVRCLDITDHSACIWAGPADGNQGDYPVKCAGDTPFGTYATYGVLMSEADGIYIKDVDIHGISHSGIMGLHLYDVEMDNVNIVANGWVGWDSDGYDADDSYYGTITLSNGSIDWNGCGEKYPLTSQDLSASTDKHHCWSQDQGGFGDAIGLGDGNPGNWTLNNMSVSHNTSDGIDLLHGDGSGNIIIRRTVAEGNAGNPVKVTTSSLIENSKIIANCKFFDGQTFTSTVATQDWEAGCLAIGGTWSNGKCYMGFNNCRGSGFAVSSMIGGSRYVKIYGSTIYGNGDTIFDYSHASECSSPTFEIANSIILAGLDHTDITGEDRPDWLWNGDADASCQSVGINVTYSQINGLKNSYQPTGTGNIYTEPEFADSPIASNYQGLSMDVNLTSGSDAIGAASESVSMSAVDFNGFARGESWDIGAYENDTQGGGSSCSAELCSACYSSSTCVTAGCNWWTSNICNTDAETCGDNCATSVCVNEATCEGASCYWHSNDTCDIDPEPCSTTCVGCTSESDCEEIIESTSSCMGGWNFNENTTNGQVDDVCGTINGISKNGNTAINTSTIATTGYVNGAFSFDSAVNIDMGNTLGLDYTETRSIEAGIKTSNTANEKTIVGKMNGLNGWTLSIDGTTLFFFYGDAEGDYIYCYDDTTDITNNAWHHVIATYDGSGACTGVAFYIDDVAVSAKEAGTSVNSSSSNSYSFAVGSRSGGANDTPWIGQLDNIRIYNKVLNTTEKQTLYDQWAAANENIFDSTQACFWQSDDTCTDTIESACDSACSSCVAQDSCESSAAGCYWWTSNTCNDTPQTTGGGASMTIGGCSMTGIKTE